MKTDKFFEIGNIFQNTVKKHCYNVCTFLKYKNNFLTLLEEKAYWNSLNINKAEVTRIKLIFTSKSVQ